MSVAYACMKARHRGIAVLVLNREFDQETGIPERLGVYEDFIALKDAFTNLGFHVFGYANLSAKEILTVARLYSEQDFSEYGCFAMAISSHGEQHCPTTGGNRNVRTDCIVGTDGKLVMFDTILAYFREDKKGLAGTVNATLKGKPKLFFMQACRGGKLSETATAEDGEVNTENNSEKGQGDMGTDDLVGLPHEKTATFREGIFSDDMPLQRHFLLACSTPPDYYAFQNSCGSWFFREISEVFQELHETTDVVRMLSDVNWRVATKYSTNTPSTPEVDRRWTHDRRVMPWVASMLTMELYI